MRLKTLFLLLVLVLSVMSLVNCSRESSIKENVNLRNNHSVVFIYSTPFENPEAFADSIINLSNPDSVIVSDTVTVTIGDTIHMMGFLRYNADKIYLYQWILDSLAKDTTGKGKDVMKKALVTGHNATPMSWVYQKEGVYSPLFVAIDGNSATDTAGKDQFIRVINTPPYLGVPEDTLWTKAKSPITFPVLALDSFGTITSFKVDVDAKGKREPKEWKYERSETSDSLWITIPYDSTLTDSLGNQKIYIIVTDDDNNTTKDSVNLHFNQLPTIKILGPDDQQRVSDSVESFRLFYEGHDKDNEEDLRYYVRVAATPDNQDADLNLSNVYDLVLKNSTATSFVVVENGENALKKLGYTGRYFSWDVWVTDGYDTVVAEKIKTSKGVRPRFFYLGPSKTTCDFIGTAKFEGLSVHSGIKISLVNTADTANIYTANTNPEGEFRVSDLPPGVFRLTATDETGRGFVKVTTRTPNINAGDEKELPPILLKDPSPPRIYNIKGFEDTVAVRAFTVSGRFSDYGSQVKTAVAVLGKDTCGTKNSPCKFTNLTSYSWSVELSGLSDGNYSFKITATDSAGYHSDTTFAFVVSATNMTLTVNDASSAMAGESDELVFKVAVDVDAKPPVTEVTWKTNVPGDSPRQTGVSNGIATIKLKKSQFPTNVVPNTRYMMQAVADNGAISNTVRFGFYSDGPMVTIISPAYDTTITLNDEISLVTEVIPNDGTASITSLDWTCFEGDNKTENCFPKNTQNPKKSWANSGTKRIAVVATNSQGKTATDTLRINVIKDPPTITVDDNEGTITKKVGSKHKVEYTAKDKYGTVNEVGVRCGSSAYVPTAIASPKNVVEGSLEIQLPNTESSDYKCYIFAKDDDNQKDSVLMTFKVIKDIPTIRLDMQWKELTIKDVEYLKYSTSNILGGPIAVSAACGGDLERLKVSMWPSAPVYFPNVTSAPAVQMPSEPGEYYCVMQAADGDNLSLYSLDTTTYVVYKAPPTVTVTESITATIKDTLTLYANAQDSASSKLPGGIVSYEWGCGPANDANLSNRLVQGGATYKAIMPNEPYNNYLCMVRVTDTDGLTATGTTRIVVELDPPTVTVARKLVYVRPGYRIVLNASASDGKGYIAKREWGCGQDVTDINRNYRTVSSFDTTWTAPQAAVHYYCVARATDDDGNIATDTMTLQYSSEMPVISVTEKQVYVAQGDVFFLNATINNVWQGINWYSWQCFYKDNKQAAESLRKLDYSQNGERFYDYREQLSSQGRDLYCVVSAEEKATGAVFEDTTNVKVLTAANDLPIGRITAADTIYPWSGDEAQSGEALYYYSPEWGGFQSQIGTIGDMNNREFYWQFSNVGSGFYLGDTTGGPKIDTAMAQFNQAFRRPTNEGSIRMCLDFRDSIPTANSDGFFMKRHQAETTCRTIYVRRAWRNLMTGKDTVLETTPVRTPPAIASVGKYLSVAYLRTATEVISKNYDDTTATWTTLSTSAISVSDDISAIRLTSNGTDLYMAVLTSGNTVKVFRSAGGTSPWVAFGAAIENAKSVNITSHPTSGYPVVAYARGTRPYIKYWRSGAWDSLQISTDKTVRDVNAVFSSEGYLFTTYTDDSYLYNTYYAICNIGTNSRYTVKKSGLISKEMASISLSADDKVIYMGYLNRSSVVGRAGPYVKRGTLSQSAIEWDNAFEKNLQEGMLPSNIRVAARGGKAYAIIDDNGRGMSHCHAYIYDGVNWRPYGENQLPYFKGPFYTTHHYYLYGFAPEIVINKSGYVFISMISWPNSGVTNDNNGPIIMKNVSKNWTINTKP